MTTPAIILNSGALDGADRFTRETAMWRPSMRSPDNIINGAKTIADARGRDTVRNNGYAAGAVARHKDSIVGAQYRLNATPNWKVLSTYSKSFDDAWADDFQQIVEARFTLIAESDGAWLDAQGVNTLTGMIRLAVGVFMFSGEHLSTVEWDTDTARPLKTNIQFVASDRLCNPFNTADSMVLRRGVERTRAGKPIAYNIRMGDPTDPYIDNLPFLWKRIPVTKPWGRKQVIHIIEQGNPDQSRGLSEMVACLKNMHMTRKFQDVTLQNAVVQATYAAAIESELPPEAIAVAMGQSANGIDTALLNMYASYMGALGQYLDAANSIRIDGAQIPHLFPGTKLNMQAAKTVGGVGTSFEESLMRHTAASLGLSYEEFSRDFSKTNYSSGRAALGVSAQYMAARKKHVADRLATNIYALVLEEEMANGNVPLPRNVSREAFYLPLAKEAFTSCKWIGSGAGQIDELKETQAAGLRVSMGISTWEIECARLGFDWREMFQQRAREQKVIDDLKLTFDLTTTKPTGGPAEAAPAEPASGAAP